LEISGTPVSASAVRACLEQGDWDTLKTLLPETTYEYLKKTRL
jgi:citrate lyase synthetase